MREGTAGAEGVLVAGWGGALAGGALGWFGDSEGGLCGLQEALD